MALVAQPPSLRPLSRCAIVLLAHPGAGHVSCNPLPCRALPVSGNTVLCLTAFVLADAHWQALQAWCNRAFASTKPVRHST